MLENRVNGILCLCFGLFSLFPLVSAAEDDAKKPVPIAAQEEPTPPTTDKKPVPLAAQEPTPPTTTTPKPSAEPESADKPAQSQPQADEDDETKQLAQAVKKLQLEQAKLRLEHEQKLLKLQQEKERLSLENELHFVKQNKLLAELNALKSRLELENALRAQQQQKLLAALQTERENIAMRNAVQAERNRQKELEIHFETTQMEFQRLKLSAEMVSLNRKIATRSKTEEWESQVNKPKEYLKEPFVNGQLVISDRKIVLDGPIFGGTAEDVVGRIQYYNNKTTEYPIFIVIDYCPGGSVMEGSRILKAMKTSRAPVYVVVKSFAASMAAVITTLAERSYALPDAVIIHHQVSGISMGNRTEHREQLKVIDEWSERIIQPVAEKMGITLNEFTKKMYEHNSIGDWFEFATGAVNYKWVSHIIEDIRDTSYTKRPVEQEGEDDEFLQRLKKIDERGNRYVKLPRLRPMDVYHLHNPDNYYRY
jgi:ATP-dependent Clp protease protease subunit